MKLIIEVDYAGDTLIYAETDKHHAAQQRLREVRVREISLEDALVDQYIPENSFVVVDLK